MNYEELDKTLRLLNFARISADTWIFRTPFINTYLTASNDTVELLFQSIGTNMVMINRKEKFPANDASKAITYCESVTNALSDEVELFIKHCSKLMSRERITDKCSQTQS